MEQYEKVTVEVKIPADQIATIESNSGMNCQTVNEFICNAVSLALAHQVDTLERPVEWRFDVPDVERLLFERAEQFEPLFGDMLFEPDGATYDLAAVQGQGEDGTWYDEDVRPEILEYFMLGWFRFSVGELPDGVLGRFNPATQTLTISPLHVNNESVLLHELIHLHEFVLDSLPLYYHDGCLWSLYRSLTGRVKDLDDRIMAHGHIYHESSLAKEGGVHDLLFLLKSFDLDLQMGYPLGTVFGYGMAEE